MAQHDYVIANGTGAAVRSDLNNALAAIVSNNSGATEPATMYAYQWWADTSTGLLKLRNAANNAWITLRELDGTLTIEDGTASSPGLAFADDLNTGIYSPSADQLGITTGGTVRLTTTTTGITSALPVDVPLGTASAPTVTFTGDLNTGIYSPGADQVAISTNGTGRITIDGSGNVNIDSNTLYVDATNNRVGIGTASPAGTLDVRGTAFFGADSNASVYLLSSSTEARIGAGGRTSVSNVPLTFYVADGGANTERARIDTSGRLLVGTSSARSIGGATPQLQVEGTSNSTSSLTLIQNANTDAGAYIFLGKSRGTSSGSVTAVSSGDALGGIYFNGANGSNLSNFGASIEGVVDGTVSGGGTNDMPGRLVFSTTADGASSPTERMRINAAGALLHGKTTADTLSVAGVQLFGGSDVGTIYATRNSGEVVSINRLSTDGNLIGFYQDTTYEGNISVSGTTVSYNGAHLSRWSQIPGIDPHDKDQRPEILRGTVMSNLDEMCDWIDPETAEPQANEQLNKTKISDVEGDKNVAGIFQSWDDDDDTWVNDYYLAMTGDFIIRIAEGVTVERGDLLMSAGDGTAKPQDDDIIRSKTIAKVTSTNVSCTYEDGSYCVPCVLMAC